MTETEMTETETAGTELTETENDGRQQGGFRLAENSANATPRHHGRHSVLILGSGDEDQHPCFEANLHNRPPQLPLPPQRLLPVLPRRIAPPTHSPCRQPIPAWSNIAATKRQWIARGW